MRGVEEHSCMRHSPLTSPVREFLATREFSASLARIAETPRGFVRFCSRVELARRLAGPRVSRETSRTRDYLEETPRARLPARLAGKKELSGRLLLSSSNYNISYSVRGRDASKTHTDEHDGHYIPNLNVRYTITNVERSSQQRTAQQGHGRCSGSSAASYSTRWILVHIAPSVCVRE